VLVVEDDADMAFVLERNLRAEGYSVTVAKDGDAAVARALKASVDVVLLDLMLPKRDGFRVLRALRDAGLGAPVLLLTARRQESDKLQGFRLGADDYLTKPFSMAELLARVAALIRRSERAGRTGADMARTLRVGPIEVDVVKQSVRRDGRLMKLTPKAYDLLVALMRRANSVATRTDLMREVWGYADDVTSRTLDTHIGDLRRRLERDPAEPVLIETVWRVGYRMTDGSEPSST
jgi:DNA-binding response OmpR family regulator